MLRQYDGIKALKKRHANQPECMTVQLTQTRHRASQSTKPPPAVDKGHDRGRFFTGNYRPAGGEALLPPSPLGLPR